MPMVIVFGEQLADLQRAGHVVSCRQCVRSVDHDARGTGICPALGRPVVLDVHRLCTLFEEVH